MLLAIYGTGGTGRLILDQICRDKKMKKYTEIVFADDWYIGDKFENHRVLSFKKIRSFYGNKEIEFLICIGEPSRRKELAEKILYHGYKLGSWIHPLAEVSPSASIGEGAVILRCIIDSKVKIGENVFISWNAAIGHDTSIGAHCLISPHSFVGGGCNIGESVYVGPAAAIRNEVMIGERSVIGLAAAVYKSVEADMTAIGNPARAVPRSGTSLF